MGIDWKMLPMKMHYFLRFMGTGPLTVFLPVITRQKGVPAHVVGGIWTVLPFLSLVTKISAGTIADYARAHRAVFLGGVTLMLASLTALYWVPDVPQPCPISTTPANSTPHALDLTDAFIPTEASSGVGVGGVMLETTPPGASYDNTIPAPTPYCLESSHIKQEGGDHWTIWQRYEFWLLFLCLLGQYCGHIVGITMQETVCFQMLGVARHKYGAQRVWGTLGMGVSAMLAGALVDSYSKGRGEQDYLPAHVLTFVFLAADLVVVARIRFPRPERRTSSSARYEAHWWRSVILVLVSTGMVGVACGLLWTFEFILVEDVAKEWQPGFPHLKLLLGLIMGVQCFLTEVPFFLLAGRIIKSLGYINTFFVSLMGFCVRLCLYASITNPWWFIPADVLHGVSFAVIYPCFTAYASKVSPKGAEATTQAIFGGAFFFSTGVGGLVGGQLYGAVGGKKTFLIMGAVMGMYAVAFLGLHALLVRCHFSYVAETKEDAECEEGLRDGGERAGEKLSLKELEKQGEMDTPDDGVS